MLGDYTILDLVALGGIGTLAVSIVSIIRDNKLLRKEIEFLTQKIELLSKTNFDQLTEGSKAIKGDTGYIRDEMLTEKMARLKLYENVSNADEILNKLDFMRELVNQNAELSVQVENLKAEKQALSQSKEADDVKAMLNTINRFSRQLSQFEEYEYSDEIQGILKKLQNELS